MNKKLFVVIKDGNRTVAWDYHDDTTIRTVLANKFFAWVEDTVCVNGVPVKDADLNTPLGVYNNGSGKVRITMKRLKMRDVIGTENEAEAEDEKGG